MRRSLVLFVALLGLLLVACAPANTPAPAAAANPAVQATQAPPPKAAAPATAVSQPQATQPVATPDIEKITKPQPDDWKRGPDDAIVKIIEWGDFQ
jgi:hypothetical protein